MKYEYKGKIYNNHLDAVMAVTINRIKETYNCKTKKEAKELLANALAMNIVQNELFDMIETQLQIQLIDERRNGRNN